MTLLLAFALSPGSLWCRPDIYPAAPLDCLAPGTRHFLSDAGLASGAVWDDRNSKFYFRDFAIVVFYPGQGIAGIDVRLTDRLGLDFRYRADNLGVPLLIDGKTLKKTVLLNVAGVAFPVNGQHFEYHPNITVEITSTEPVMVLPLDQFASIGHGETLPEAIENCWQNFGFSVPFRVEERFRYVPYAIFWRNLYAFPDGWDTRISLTNNTRSSRYLRLQYCPDYGLTYDPGTLVASDIASIPPVDLMITPGETRVIYLRELLGASIDDSCQTEGSLVFQSIHFNPHTGQWEGNEVQVTVEVMPLSHGTRIGLKR
jgi:hypothetical protein